MGSHWTLNCPIGIFARDRNVLCSLCRGNNVIVVDKRLVADRMIDDDLFLCIVKEKK